MKGSGRKKRPGAGPTRKERKAAAAAARAFAEKEEQTQKMLEEQRRHRDEACAQLGIPVGFASLPAPRPHSARVAAKAVDAADTAVAAADRKERGTLLTFFEKAKSAE